MKSQILLVMLAVILTGLRASAATETVLHNFAGGAYSEYPYGGLVFDSAGNAYGTASGGGLGYGTLYELTPSHSGWTANILYSFDNVSGAYPGGPLVSDQAGNLYGTAGYGGNKSGVCQTTGCGTIFELQRVSGGWNLVVLYKFSGGSDGAYPNPKLFRDSSGNLFGTAYFGGLGYGTVFELSPSSGGWKESTVYSFVSGSQAANPVNGVTSGGSAIFYGATAYGGSQNLGTVYQLNKTASGWKQTVLHSFNGKDGENPLGGALLLRQGTLYGTTNSGGPSGQGTAFSLTPGTQTFTTICSFSGPNGSSPNGGVISDSAGNLYGITVFGGSAGYGVVFVLRNVNGAWQESLLHSFDGTDGNQPIATPTIHGGALFGTTSGGGEWDAGVDWELTAH